MPRQSTTTRPATPDDIQDIIAISQRVQDRLDESGSLQQSGPLSSIVVLDRIQEQQCFVVYLADNSQIIGLSMVKPISTDYYPQSANFDGEHLPQPWKLLHSFMLDTTFQGQSYGIQLFQDTVDIIETTGCAGTLLLDCWAGNEKLKQFYFKCGCLEVGTVPEEDYYVSVFARVLATPLGEGIELPWASPNLYLVATAPVSSEAGTANWANGLANGADGPNGQRCI